MKQSKNSNQTVFESSLDDTLKEGNIVCNSCQRKENCNPKEEEERRYIEALEQLAEIVVDRYIAEKLNKKTTCVVDKK